MEPKSISLGLCSFVSSQTGSKDKPTRTKPTKTGTPETIARARAEPWTEGKQATTSVWEVLNCPWQARFQTFRSFGQRGVLALGLETAKRRGVFPFQVGVPWHPERRFPLEPPRLACPANGLDLGELGFMVCDLRPQGRCHRVFPVLVGELFPIRLAPFSNHGRRSGLSASNTVPCGVLACAVIPAASLSPYLL